MSIWKRITIGIFCYIFALCLFSLDLDGDTHYLGALFGIAGTVALRRELLQISMLVWQAANKRADKVAKERQCMLCSAPPVYMLHLIAINPTLPVSPLAGQELHVCREHHPNKEIAEKADELHHFIKQMDSNLTYDRVYPYCFFET